MFGIVVNYFTVVVVVLLVLVFTDTAVGAKSDAVSIVPVKAVAPVGLVLYEDDADYSTL